MGTNEASGLASRNERVDMIELRVDAGMGSMLFLCLMPRILAALSGRREERGSGLEILGVVTVM